MITKISFDEILPVWKQFLWPNRVSTIETNSAMRFLGGYDIESMSTIPSFFAYMIDNRIAGVNSGHMCKDNSYRSRGVYVFPEYRKSGVGTELLVATINQGRLEGANYAWSYPRQSSWNTYKSAGYELASDWELSETSTNAYCKIII